MLPISEIVRTFHTPYLRLGYYGPTGQLIIYQRGAYYATSVVGIFALEPDSKVMTENQALTKSHAVLLLQGIGRH